MLRLKKSFVESRVSWKTKAVLVLFLLTAVIVSYGNSVHGVFVFDDYAQILHNPYIKDPANIFSIFRSGFSRMHVTGANYYRPMLEVSYMADNFLYGSWAAGYHITSIFIHMLGVVALFLLIWNIFQNIKISFLTALLFAVHPIYTSAVTYLSGRGDSMVILFILLSFLFFVKYLQAPGKELKYFVPAILFLFLALLTKETALFFVVVLFLYRYYSPKDAQERQNPSKWITIYVSIIVGVIIYLFMRSSAVSHIVTTQYNIAALSDWHVRFFTFLRAFLVYLGLLALPMGLHLERTIPLARSPFAPDILASLVLLALMIYIAVKLRKARGPIFFGIMWYLINLIPVSNIFIPLNAYIAENWIQLPALGIFLAVSSAIVYFSEKNSNSLSVKMACRMVLPAALLLAAFYSYLTVSRNEEYRDPIVFYERAIEYEPRASKLYNNLGKELEDRRGDTGRARALYQKAVEADPANVNAINNLANMYSANGRYAEAIGLFDKGLAIDKNSTMLLNNRGVTYIRKGDAKSALRDWHRSIELDPSQPQIREYISRNE